MSSVHELEALSSTVFYCEGSNICELYNSLCNCHSSSITNKLSNRVNRDYVQMVNMSSPCQLSQQAVII